MKTRRYAITGVMSVYSILSVIGWLLLFDGEAEARRRHGTAAAASRTSQPQSSGIAEVGQERGGGSQVGENQEAIVQEGGHQDAVGREGGYQGVVSQEGGGQEAVSQEVVKQEAPKPQRLDKGPRPTVAFLGGINVSFKLDPRQTNSLYRYMGEGWITPPISIHAGAKEGTTPSVHAKAEVLDVKGQLMDVSPEWIPADPEMVTVSPSQGNEVQITVKHAGQSSLQVTSQKASKKLSIMAWYQDDAIQVEITEKP